MTDEMVRFELGFRNGGSTGGSLPEDEWKKLEDALKSGGSAGARVVANSSERVFGCAAGAIVSHPRCGPIARPGRAGPPEG